MIGMFLRGGESDPDKEFEIIGNQTFMMRFMVFLAVITPPWMLCVKPLLLRREAEELKKQRQNKRINGGDYELGRVENSRQGFEEESERLNHDEI